MKAEELVKLFESCEHPMAEYNGSVMEITAVIKRKVSSQTKGVKILTSGEIRDRNQNCVYIVRASKLNYAPDSGKTAPKSGLQ